MKSWNLYLLLKRLSVDVDLQSSEEARQIDLVCVDN